MIIEDKGHASIDNPMGRGEGKGEGDRMGKGSTDTKYSPKKVLSPISRMSQIDLRMILIDPKGSEQ